jgi:hypothetical protein
MADKRSADGPLEVEQPRKRSRFDNNGTVETSANGAATIAKSGTASDALEKAKQLLEKQKSLQDKLNKLKQVRDAPIGFNLAL